MDQIDAWLQAAIADAERRGLPQLKPLLESLARSTRQLRAAEWNEYVPMGGGRKAGLSAEAQPKTGLGGAKAEGGKGDGPR
jgi:hypothetical protein